ncbi:MAG: response regulator transcription factor [Deltaproteobacteria bacterium]|nr:response regulator transcription factor [Deltaproteobacteria bacterium]
MERASTVLVVEDHPLLAQGLVALAARLGFGRCLVVSTLAAADEALARRPLGDVVAVVDVRLTHECGIELVRHWAPRGLRSLMLSGDASADNIQRSLEAGACGFVSKCEGTVTIGRAIEAVARGDTFLSEACKRALQRGSSGLSPRETEVLRCVGRGLTNKEIAAKLGLAVRTVESHRERLMTKLDAHNAADLTRAAVARGLVGRD